MTITRDELALVHQEFEGNALEDVKERDLDLLEWMKNFWSKFLVLIRTDEL